MLSHRLVWFLWSAQLFLLRMLYKVAISVLCFWVTIQWRLYHRICWHRKHNQYFRYVRLIFYWSNCHQLRRFDCCCIYHWYRHQYAVLVSLFTLKLYDNLTNFFSGLPIHYRSLLQRLSLGLALLWLGLVLLEPTLAPLPLLHPQTPPLSPHASLWTTLMVTLSCYCQPLLGLQLLLFKIRLVPNIYHASFWFIEPFFFLFVIIPTLSKIHWTLFSLKSTICSLLYLEEQLTVYLSVFYIE